MFSMDNGGSLMKSFRSFVACAAGLAMISVMGCGAEEPSAPPPPAAPAAAAPAEGAKAAKPAPVARGSSSVQPGSSSGKDTMLDKSLQK